MQQEREPPRTTLRERRRREVRRLLLDAATQMFFEHGFDAVRVVDVARACGVAEKTVYYHFATKEALLTDRWETMTSRLAAGLASRAGAPVQVALQVLSRELEDLLPAWGCPTAARAWPTPTASSPWWRATRPCAPTSGRRWATSSPWRPRLSRSARGRGRPGSGAAGLGHRVRPRGAVGRLLHQPGRGAGALPRYRGRRAGALPGRSGPPGRRAHPRAGPVT